MKVSERIFIAVVFSMAVSACCFAFAVPACAAPPDKESTVLKINNLYESDALDPFVGLKYPAYMRLRNDPVVLEHQFLGTMLTIEPEKQVPGLSFFQAVIMLVKCYDETELVMEQYLGELNRYVLENDFEHHTFSTVVAAVDRGHGYALPGRGYLVSGIVSADTAVQGMPFSEEFRNFVLPGNVNLRVIFKYPTSAQNNKLMRKDMETILSSLVVHAEYFNLSGDTSLRMLKKY